MSKEERAIHELRVLYERERGTGHMNPGGELANRRVALLKQARDWESAEMRRGAADLIRETLEWIPWGGNKEKRAERARELEEMRTK